MADLVDSSCFMYICIFIWVSDPDGACYKTIEFS